MGRQTNRTRISARDVKTHINSRVMRFPRSQPEIYAMAAGSDPIVVVDQVSQLRNAAEGERIRQMELEDKRRNERDGGMWSDEDEEEDPILARLAKRAAGRNAEKNAGGMKGMQEGDGEDAHAEQRKGEERKREDGEKESVLNSGAKQAKVGDDGLGGSNSVEKGDSTNEKKDKIPNIEGLSDLSPEEIAKKLKEVREYVKKNGVIDSAMVKELGVSELDRWKEGGVLFQNDTIPQDNATIAGNVHTDINMTAVIAKLGNNITDKARLQQLYKKNIRVAMLSIPRKEKYVFETVTSLMLSTNYPLHLHMYIGVANREVKTFYEPFNHMPRVTIHPWDIPPGKYPYRITKARANYGRILMDFHRTIEEAKAQKKKPPQGLLILEDDLRIGHDSIERLIQGINRIEAFGIQEYVLDCYVVSFASLMITNIRGIMQRMGTPTCTQCMYFPAAVVPSLPQYILDTKGPKKFVPYDLAIGGWLNITKSENEKPKPWFSLRQSIVDHMGTKTTGLAGPNVKMHHARNFVP
eukprot:comp23553_c1_seq2/m.39774 comp23553_c1_seq2/g.39774  ORF comp23553_c1_seq2/g.39774 comp23553_c1_seq2/m.39774 type:complete len:524 (-) comp23553_c1_seq2:617-2188(-)